MVVSSRDGVGLATFGVSGVFAGFSGFLFGAHTQNVCIIFEAHTRLKFAANVRNDQNVGFLLKHKSKDDKGSMRGDSRNDDEAKQRSESREEARKAGMVIINHASINADSSIFFSLLQTLPTHDLAVSPAHCVFLRLRWSLMFRLAGVAFQIKGLSGV